MSSISGFGEMKTMSIAKFGHVSENQWREAWGDRITEVMALEDIPLPRRALVAR